MKGLRHHTQMAVHVCLQMSAKVTQTVMQRSGFCDSSVFMLIHGLG